MKALIVGITGFVGQYLAEHLVAVGDQVMGSSFRDSWHAGMTASVRDQVTLFEWDLTQPLTDACRSAIAEFAPDCIFHLAAVSVPAQCGDSKPNTLAHAVNVGGTQAVIELARSLPQAVRLLVASSAHVYAPVSPDAPIVNEDSPVGPGGGYGKTKLAAEKICRQAVDEGLDVVVVRAFQHSGPRQLPEFVLPEWAEQFATPSDEPIHVVTLDSQIDLSDVRDVVRAYRLLMRRPTRHVVYNVGSGKSVHLRSVFDQLNRLSGSNRIAVERKPGFRQHPIADITRLTNDTQWSPEIPLEKTIADTLADFLLSSGDTSEI